MVATNSIDSSVLSAVNQTAASSTSAADDLGTNFMTLLVTQLQNQDPLNPMENTELTSQLAQINTVDGIENLNQTLLDINTQLDAGQQLQASMLIGRGVMVPGDQVLVGKEGVTTPFGIELENPAADVRVSVVSEAGEVVRTFSLGAQDAGSDTLVWDGLLENGDLAPEGAYRVMVEALDANGTAMPVTPLAYAVVNGVSKTAQGEPLLDLGGVIAPITLDEVRQIL